ncbi:sensor histidine kinase [Rufibacter roseus]|uniref:histidine kinase n=1 Tax=Rufibacter roseus TaxID=1567108 RepID=A0ABW2DSQ2_9BACT|nr:sensor histidine kinase [Rufibacter roseus]
MKLITKIHLAIGFILFTFCVVTIGYIKQTNEVKENVEDVLYTSDVIKESETAQKMILDMETGLRGYLLTGNRNFLSPFFNGQKGFARSFDRLDSLTASVPQLNLLVQQVNKDVDVWLNSFARPLVRSKSSAPNSPRHKAHYDSLFAATAQIGSGKKIIDMSRQRFAQIQEVEEASRKRRLAEMNSSLLNTNDIAIGLTLFAIVTGIITANLLGNTIRKRFIKMNALANSIANGDYSASLKDYRHDEISTLTNSLNIMASKLKESFTHLTKVNQELDQFAYVVSHDLKAPLRAINNLAEWIAEDLETQDPDIIHNIKILRGRVQRMENLINGILDYSKVGRKNLPQVPFSVREVMQETIENLSPPASFVFSVPQDLPTIVGERTLFYQVCSNLFSNSVKYHHKTEGHIQIRCTELEDFYQFEVQDDGPGIPKEFHTKVFGIFQTMEARDVKESTGVGLAIVKKIIEEKGGSIWIDSERGEGSTFVFTWPKVPVTATLKLQEHE